MNFRENINFNKRVFIDIRTKDKKLIDEINQFWRIEKGYQKNIYNKLDENFSDLYKIEFDNGVYKKTLIKINSRFDLIRTINLLKNKLEEEFNYYVKLDIKENIKIQNDVHFLFNSRLDDENLFKEKVTNLSNNETELKKTYKKLNKIEFNSLLAIAQLKNKEDIVNLFRQKGFNWSSLNKLSKLGFLWVRRDFDNMILEFIMDNSIRNRILNYIENNGIDIYNLEFI